MLGRVYNIPRKAQLLLTFINQELRHWFSLSNIYEAQYSLCLVLHVFVGWRRGVVKSMRPTV